MIVSQYKRLMGELYCRSFGRNYVILSTSEIEYLKKKYPIGWFVRSIKEKIDSRKTMKENRKFGEKHEYDKD